MIKIYFYSNKGINLYSCYASSLAEALESPASYYRDYTEDIFITDIEFKYPKIEDGTIREKTREEIILEDGVVELLEVGEKIEDGKVVEYPQPSPFHNWNGSEWELDLNTAKKLKRNESKAIREKKQNEPLEFKGNLYQVEYPKDTKNFDLIQSELVRMKLMDIDIKPYLKQKMKWTLLDNTDVELTIKEILELATAYTNRYKQVHYYCNQVLYPKIAKAKSAEEIEMIKWE